MTHIDFYLLESDRYRHDHFVCQLCQKAYDKKQNTLLLTQNQQQTQHFDHMLWTYSEASFLPHDAEDSEDFATPVLINDNPDITNDRQLLINLSASVPEYFAQFKRVIELVTKDLRE